MNIGFRNLLVCLVAVLALGAVASASASAFDYEVCEKGGTEKFETNKCAKTSSSGEFSFKKVVAPAEPATTSTGGEFELKASGKSVHCTAVTDKGKIKAGGADEATEIKFTGCKNDPKTCTAESPGAAKGTIIVTDIPTQLVERVNPSTKGKVLADEFKSKTNAKGEKEFVTLEFDKEGAACPEYPTTKVKGQVAAEVTNLANGEISLDFVLPELEGNTLEAFGEPASLDGKVESSLASGAASRASKT